MPYIIILIIFIFGLCIGSFLNCLVYRIESKKSFTRGRSLCPKCHHKLGVLDLIPILSFLMLKRKCRYCKKNIAWQYPAIEILTGLVFLLIFNFQFSIFDSSILQFFNFQTIISLVYLLIIGSFLIVIFIYDLKHYIIPDKILYPAVALTLLYRFINFESLLPALVSAVLASGFFFLIWLVSKGKWMGFGDVKLALFMGLFLGWPDILVALFSAFLIGSVAGIGLMVLGKKKLKSQVPFGPFLIIGTFLALFWGREIITWYLSFI
ncbi:MAG: prepilin peptidase [Parcubacteria group bacterium]|nr:prepilin peptidase [Parcubacteria group bacterium]